MFFRNSQYLIFIIHNETTDADHRMWILRNVCSYISWQPFVHHHKAGLRMMKIESILRKTKHQPSDECSNVWSRCSWISQNTWDRIGTIPACLRSTLNQIVRCAFIRQCCKDSNKQKSNANARQYRFSLFHFHFHLLSSCSGNWFKSIAAKSVSIVMPSYRSSVPLKTSMLSLILVKFPNDLFASVPPEQCILLWLKYMQQFRIHRNR